MNQKKDGIFVVIDGIDGTGKSSIVSLLNNYLIEHGISTLILKEPGDSDYGKEIKNLIRQKKANTLSNKKWVELFTLDRKENEEKIKKALLEKKVVILDRYYYSTLAYQLSPKEWQEYSSSFLKPTLAIILDNDVSISLDRINKRKEAKINELKKTKTFFEKEKTLRVVRKKFLDIPRVLNDNLKIIDSSRQLKEVWFDVKTEINKIIN